MAQEERLSSVNHQIRRKPVASASPLAGPEPQLPSKTEPVVGTREAIDDEYINSAPCGDWKPIALRWPFLSLLIILHAVFIIVIQLLLHSDDKAIGSFAVFEGTDSGHYFMWQFFPTGCAVVSGALWEMADTRLRVLAPYYAMARPHGATVEESLSVDYLSTYILILPFLAADKKDWAVVCSSSAYILSCLVLPAVTGHMWWLDFSSDQPHVQVEYQIGWLRAFQAINAFTIILGVSILFFLGRKRSGLHKDPSSLASIASIMIESTELLHVLQPLRSFESRESIDDSLRPIRFYLRQPDKEQPIRIVLKQPAGLEILPDNKEFKQSRSEAHSVWLWGRVYLLVQVTLMVPYVVIQVAVGTFVYKGSPSSIDPLLVRFCYTLTFAIASTLYQIIQRELSIMQPFYNILPSNIPWSSRGGPLPYSYSARTTVTLMWYSVRHNASILAVVSFWCFCLQLMTIFFPPMFATVYDLLTISGSYGQVPDVIMRAAQPLKWINWMVLALSLVPFISHISRKRKAIIPRQPNTLVSQMVYLCGSMKLLQDMKGTFHMSQNRFDKHLDRLWKESKEPVFQWFQDSNGTWRAGIEYKPVEREYTYGQSAPPPETV